jgi:hypothetical protein
LTVELVFLYPYGRVRYLDLPKLGCRKHVRVVLVSTGNFNPPTYMHLRMFELARDALLNEGYYLLGGYMSPVGDAYDKKVVPFPWLSSESTVVYC